MLATAYADEMYVAVRVISDHEMDRYNLAEFLELLTAFFKLAVSLMLILFDVIHAVNDLAAILAAAYTAANLFCRLMLIFLKALGYGIGLPI